jgi:hypothetical protein
MGPTSSKAQGLPAYKHTGARGEIQNEPDSMSTSTVIEFRPARRYAAREGTIGLDSCPTRPVCHVIGVWPNPGGSLVLMVLCMLLM